MTYEVVASALRVAVIPTDGRHLYDLPLTSSGLCRVSGNARNSSAVSSVVVAIGIPSVGTAPRNLTTRYAGSLRAAAAPRWSAKCAAGRIAPLATSRCV